MTIRLSDKDAAVVIAALNTAAYQYEVDSALPEAGERIREQFQRQAKEARVLAERIKEQS